MIYIPRGQLYVVGPTVSIAAGNTTETLRVTCDMPFVLLQLAAIVDTPANFDYVEVQLSGGAGIGAEGFLAASDSLYSGAARDYVDFGPDGGGAGGPFGRVFQPIPFNPGAYIDLIGRSAAGGAVDIDFKMAVERAPGATFTIA